jgi:hypothetical protein
MQAFPLASSPGTRRTGPLWFDGARVRVRECQAGCQIRQSRLVAGVMLSQYQEQTRRSKGEASSSGGCIDRGGVDQTQVDVVWVAQESRFEAG